MNIFGLLVPYDSGHPRKRNGLGPEHLWSSIEPMLTRLGHTTRSEVLEGPPVFQAEIATAFQLARMISERVRMCRERGWLPLVLSGNCNASLGTVSGCGCSNTSVVWFDAHGESTTPDTTSSGFLDGMGISMLTDNAWHHLVRTVPGFAPLRGNQIVLVGARDVEAGETELLTRVGVQRAARAEDLHALLPSLQTQGDGVYLHLDLDVLDPQEATANQWPAPNGLTVSAMVDAIATLQRQVPIKAVGLASYAPEVDRDGRALRAAVSLIEAALHA